MILLSREVVKNDVSRGGGCAVDDHFPAERQGAIAAQCCLALVRSNVVSATLRAAATSDIGRDVRPEIRTLIDYLGGTRLQFEVSA